MKQTKRVLFTFSPYEYKGVEVYLNSLAARGWELVKVGSVLASFRRTQRTDLTYCTDLLTYRRRQGGRGGAAGVPGPVPGGGLGAGGPAGEHGPVRLPAGNKSCPHPDRPGHRVVPL